MFLIAVTMIKKQMAPTIIVRLEIFCLMAEISAETSYENKQRIILTYDCTDENIQRNKVYITYE
jgi:hypothetical protein